MIQVVLDTNVFVSAIFWGGSPFKILAAWQEIKLQIVFSHEINETCSVHQSIPFIYLSLREKIFTSTIMRIKNETT